MNTDRSKELFARAQDLLPGGVSSPVRAFRAVGGEPLFIARGDGPYLYDVDGNRYIDYVLSWGPLILGHAHPEIVGALQAAIAKGTSYGAPSLAEVQLAARIREAMPNIEMLRFVNSGTEATMSAIRLARAYTGRDKVVKFAGCYHGHADLLLVKAGSGVATLGLPDSPGVPADATRHTLVASYNDLISVEGLFTQNAGEIAALIVEPVAGNMGVVLPREGFLPRLRELCDQHGALLIFDEVMTGFRVHPGGAQALYGVRPDLTTLGKVIGGGLPVGAYGGRRDIMEMVAPAGPVYQAGTLSGNPLAMAAGLATLEQLQKDGVWGQLMETTRALVEGIGSLMERAKIEARLSRVGTMFSIFFNPDEVIDWASAKRSDEQQYARFFARMLQAGIYLPPSQFESYFTSTAHDEEVVQTTIRAVEQALWA